ncbi:UvrD-helicase domain-containing protein [Oleiagrimonas sp.]|jgi:exodeoxyribonuclease V beta subunit|uniref:UvrD-helicase domain-containing protein n=1 Tax=Oleiagrimonas sp. TaxID=2010330 RepID=UPI0026125C5A|nr:UvrD-helicase domain-containing protein [Oleiagrimonas sp.]MDA3913827.1 UvrD-helicase domain-containing protein [Oleiagrimonas sp.]
MNEPRYSLARTDMALRVPLSGVQQIEASAGTGKTYTISGLYVRLVAEHQLEVRQILVMTFTKAATEELRQRLRQRLAVCAQVAAQPWLHQGAPPADASGEQLWALSLLRGVLEKGDETAAQLARRLEQAVTRMDEAAIFTIHGFCQRVLGEYTSLIDGVSGMLALEPSDRDLLEVFAADAWLRLGGSVDEAERCALQAFGTTPQALADTLKGLVDFAGRIEPAAEGDEVAPEHPDTARAALVQAWVEGGDAAVSVFGDAFHAGHLNKGSYKESSLEQLQALRARLLGGGWPSMAQLQKFAGKKLKGSVKSNQPPFRGHAAFTAIDAWLQTDRAWQMYIRSRLPRVLHRLVDEARGWLAMRKRDLVRMSYADQVDWVHRGLNDGTHGARLRKALRTQYPVALVDEFQDTDVRQFEIFRHLYEREGTLFCIGDPKQAIYGFRGGDVHAYLRAKRLADHHWSLDHNYRSAPGLLAACEALFTQRGEVFVEDGIAFEQVQPGGHVADAALQVATGRVAPMTVWRLPDAPVGGGKPGLETLLAASCAGAVARLLAPDAASLDGGSLRPGSIAVLVDSNRQAMRVQDALADAGVPAVCQRRESVYASEEATELRRILDAMLAPRHAGLARAALSTRLLGRRLGDLAAMLDTDADWRAELDDLRARWLQRGVLAMLERLGERHARRLLSEPGGERVLSNLMQIGDALQAEARHLSSVHAQRDWLARRIERADDHNEEEQLRLDSDAARVQIMTVHASKGLEFDLVFLPFTALMQATPPSKGAFASYHDGDDLVKRFIASGSDERDPDDDAALAAAQREDLAEGVRKLYVGVTRARHACWFSAGTAAPKFKGHVLDWVLPEGVDALFGASAGHVLAQALPEPAVLDTLRANVGETLQARVFTRSMDRDWRSHSFTRLAEGGHGAFPELATRDDKEAATGPAQKVPALGAGLHGSRFGSAVHDMLERIDFAAWSDPDAVLPESQRVIVERALAAQGFVSSAARAPVEGLLRRTLCTPFLDDLTLARLPREQRREEMEFHFGMDGTDPRALLDLMHAHGYQTQRLDFAHVGRRLAGLMTGIIDLVLVHEGQWWVVDYKTNHLGDTTDDYAPARLQDAVRASDYDLQYLIYTVALHRWLGQVLGADYDYARDFGGIRYLYLRGMGMGAADNGIFADRPPAELVLGMDELLRAPGRAGT